MIEPEHRLPRAGRFDGQEKTARIPASKKPGGYREADCKVEARRSPGFGLGETQSGRRKRYSRRASSVLPNPTVLARLAAAVRKGNLSIPVVKTFKLSEAAAAQKLAEEGKGDGKIVLIP
jgi:NADPH:quinone reductase-like Zn-dependent oxidoreductase